MGRCKNFKIMKKAENKVGMELIRQRMNTERSLDDFIPIGGDVVGGDRDLRVRGLVSDSGGLHLDAHFLQCLELGQMELSMLKKRSNEGPR